MKLQAFVSFAAVGILLAGCGGGAATGGADASGTTAAAGSPSAIVQLTILGAASLKGVLDQAKAAYESAHPGTTLTIATDSSATLETQIEQGAPADVFLSADTFNPAKLADGGFTVGEPVVFATNELTIIVPAGNPAGIASPADLARPSLKIVAAGDEVPITKYANQLVVNLGKQPGYPAGFAAAYAANVVSREDNVKAVMAKIELGEGDAGIVYVTDAAGSPKIQAIGVPEAANVVADYAGVVLKASPNQAAAQAFLQWFAGPGGEAILRSFGFLPPAP